jgi:hypothetical protein
MEDDIKIFLRGMRRQRKVNPSKRAVKVPTSAPITNSGGVVQVGAGLGEKCSLTVKCHTTFCIQSPCPQMQCIDSICKLPAIPTKFPTSSPVESIQSSSNGGGVVQVGAGLGEKCSQTVACHSTFCVQSPCPQMQCIDNICKLPTIPTKFPTSSPVEEILP